MNETRYEKTITANVDVLSFFRSIRNRRRDVGYQKQFNPYTESKIKFLA